ncbi:TetR/AcrR family transcriptional regulator [Devriesea agamarum]|uniref:TetR/AcrR family transcriptional regulator n=1 Tax=Devriesea agamarum TaxID=472569 RepID=UPI00071C2DDC|nr:TetR/AcrR family transcriptional regulator [Devriesea agamarum]
MPKIIGRSLEDHRQQTRTRIFNALGDLMESNSFESITFAQIAAKAGVGRTALYNHFSDKESLVLAYAMHETSGYVDQLRAGMAHALDPVDAMRLYIRTQLDLRRSFHFAPGPELRSVLSTAALLKMREHVKIIEDVLREVLDSGVSGGYFTSDLDIEATMPLISACLIGRHIPEEEGPARERAIEAATTFVLRALSARLPETLSASEASASSEVSPASETE